MEHRKRQHTIKQGRSGSRLGAGSRPCPCECLRRCVYRRIAGAGVIKHELLERRQRAAVERGDEGGAPGVRDLGVAEAELL